VLQAVFVIALVVAFVGLSLVADRSARGQRIVTGIVTEWRAGESIAVANEQTDPKGFRIGLRNTLYEGDTNTIKSGVRVTVWYRNVGERRPVADRVRVLDAARH
jgi:hypothetical protein